MKKSNIKKKVLIAAIAASMVISLESTAFALTKSMPINSVKEKLDSLVKSSVISQQQEENIINFMKEKEAARKAEMDKVKGMTEEERKAYFSEKSKTKTSLISDIVSKGIVSQQQADEISKVLPQKGNRVNLTSKLDELIKNGSITQEDKEKISAYMDKKRVERKSEKEKVKQMTEEERKAYFSKNKKE